MALKGDRVVLDTDITLTCPSAASRGVTLVHKTAGSGVALGSTAGQADLVSNPSGYKVAGLLLLDVVDVDETRYHRNWFKQEQLINEPVPLLRKGRVTTDKVTGSPTAGSTAYLTSNGVLTPTKSTTGGLVATPPVGEFKSSIDENGYATVELNLPFPTV